MAEEHDAIQHFEAASDSRLITDLEMVDNMCTEVFKMAHQKSFMKLSRFESRFSCLFQLKTQEKYREAHQKQDQELIDHYDGLMVEFASEIDTYNTLKIVDDHTNEVIIELPALRNRVTALSSVSDTDAIVEFENFVGKLNIPPHYARRAAAIMSNAFDKKQDQGKVEELKKINTDVAAKAEAQIREHKGEASNETYVLPDEWTDVDSDPEQPSVMNKNLYDGIVWEEDEA